MHCIEISFNFKLMFRDISRKNGVFGFCVHPVVGACKICTPVLNQVEIEIFLGEMGHLFEWEK